MNRVSFIVPGPPTPKERPKLNKFGRAVTPEKTLAAERRVEEIAREAMSGRDPFFGPIRLLITLVFETPSGWVKRQREDAISGFMPHVATPDLDNVEKMVCDGMNGVVYYDDSQVAEKHSRKRYGRGNRIEVTAEVMEFPPSHPGITALRERIAEGKYSLKAGETRRRTPKVTAPETASIGKRLR